MQPAHRLMIRWAEAVRGWAIWTLPRWLAAIVLLAIAADVTAIGAAVAVTSVTAHDLILFALLATCVVITVEFTRHEGEKKGLIKDIYSAWGLPAAILLPPVYVLVMTALYYPLLQWRVRKTALYKRVFRSVSSTGTMECGLSWARSRSEVSHRSCRALFSAARMAGLTWP